MIWLTINGGGDDTLGRLAASMQKVEFEHWRIMVQGRSGASLWTLGWLKRTFGDRVTVSRYPYNLGVVQGWNENLAWLKENFPGRDFINCDDDIEIVDSRAGEYLLEGLADGVSCANREAFFMGARLGTNAGVTEVEDHATAFVAYRAIAAKHWHDWRRIQYAHDTEWHSRIKRHGRLLVDWRDTIRHYNQTGTMMNHDAVIWNRIVERDRALGPLPWLMGSPPMIWRDLPGYVIEEGFE
jgi:hypothetical protein